MHAIPTSHYIMLSAALFAVGVLGVLVRRNAIVVFLAIELMLNAVNLAFVALARHMGPVATKVAGPIGLSEAMQGQVIVLFVVAVAGAEVAVGLAIIVALFRNKRTLDVDEVNLMKG
ncbi:MAG: NADH-quinone oxidoreductase subunit NuoK [Armatimonadota bacterium]|jgi:NADH-quinone oxidoreductase subunit K